MKRKIVCVDCKQTGFSTEEPEEPCPYCNGRGYTSEIEIPETRVAVLTTFMGFPQQYGLVPVVLNQLRLLVKQGYTPKFIVQEQFDEKEEKKIPDGVELLKIMPFFHMFDFQEGRTMEQWEEWNKETDNELDFASQIKKMEEALEPTLKECDVVITHDIIFQTWFILFNQAIRNIAKRNPNIRWLHWCHSGPCATPDKLEYPHILRHSGMPNAKWVIPNETMTSGFAFMYNIPKEQIAVVNHTFNPYTFFSMHPLSILMSEKHDLIRSDILCVWATRLDAPASKGFKFAVWLVAQLNKLCNAKMLFLNSWSNSKEAKDTIKNLRATAEEWGLPQRNLVFSSDMGKKWELGVPHKVVRDMLWIGNLFFLPSQTETFSLSMVEAGATKNLAILNSDLTVMKELVGDNAFYLPCGSEWGGTKTTQQYNPNPQRYFADRAKEIYDIIQNNKALTQQRNIFKNYTETAVWNNQLKKLIEG